MMRKLLFVSFLYGYTLWASCGSSEEKPLPRADKSKAAASSADKVLKETQEAVQATKDYAYGQKAEFIEKTRQDLVQIQQEVDRLAAQVATARKETQSEANAKLQVVRDKADKLNKQFEQLKGATDASWNEVKAGFRKSRGELNSSFNEARQRLADKIAP